MLKQALRAAIISRNFTQATNIVEGPFTFGSTNTSTISIDNALTLSALYNGINIISNDVAMLPKAVYTKVNGITQKQPGHPVHNIIALQPNSFQTSYWLHKIMITTAILNGNAVAVIRRHNTTGQIDPENALVFVHPNDLQDIKLIDGQLWFFTKQGIFHNSEVIHIKGFSQNGYTGISVLRHAATNFNAAISADAFAQSNFDGKGMGLGIIKHNASLTPKAKKNLADAMEARLSAAGKYNIGVVDEGMDYKPISVSAQEAQLIDWKKITVEDVARWLNVSPRKLKQATNVTAAKSVEQGSIDHLSDAILPWVVQFEQEYNSKLFTTKEKPSIYTKFNISALLRVDAAARAEYYNKMRFAGIYTGNEIRILEDLNPIDLPFMNEPLQPVQLMQQQQIKNNIDNGK